MLAHRVYLELASLVLAAVALLLAVRFLPFPWTWLRVRRMRIRPPGIRLAEPSALPTALEPMHAAADDFLGRLGFVASHAQWVDSVEAGEAPRPCYVYVHPETGTYARVWPPVFGNGRRLFAVTFTTALSSGRVVATMDGLCHLSPVLPPSWECRDECLNDVTQQWALHEAALARVASPDPAVRFTPDRFAAWEQEQLAEAITHARAQGSLVEAGRDRWRLRARAAGRFARGLLAGQRRMARTALAPVPALDGPPAAATESFVFERALELSSPRWSLAAKTGLFVLSLAIFALAFGWLFSWRLVPPLFVVLLIHELGHLAGMIAFGFRDRQLLFLPLVGAAAIGRKDDATALQRLVVLLLGPVPGILLGFGCLLLARSWGSTTWFEIAVLFLALNYINLLPVVPLDGGRIVEVLFLHRSPRAATLFLAGSALLLAAASIAFHDTVLLIIAATLFLVAPAHWRLGQATRAAAARLSHWAARPERLRAIFETLDEPPFARLGPSGRLQMARGVLQRLEGQPPTLRLAVSGAVLYTVLLLAPVGGFAVYVTQRSMMPGPCAVYATVRWFPDTAPEPADPTMRDICRDRTLRRLPPDRQWDALVQRGQTKLQTGQPELASQYFQLALLVSLRSFGPDDPRYDRSLRLLEAAAQARGSAPITRPDTASRH